MRKFGSKMKAMIAVLTFLVCLGACTNQQESGEADTVVTGSDVESAETTAETGEAAQTTLDYSDIKVAILLPGVITDSGWNTVGYNSIQNLTDKYGITADYVESVPVSDFGSYAKDYAELGYNVIIAHGSQFADATNEVAANYPDTTFILSYASENVSEQPNVICAGPVNEGTMYGLIAGALTTTDHVAFLGGEDVPIITAALEGFTYGVSLTNPDCVVETAYIGSLTDANKAYEMAIQYINDGVDVIIGCANSAGLGVLQAADEKDILAVGAVGDQYNVAPDSVVVSVLRDYVTIYDDMITKIAADELDDVFYTYTLQQGGCCLSDWHGWDAKLDAEKYQLIMNTLEGIKNGTIAEAE
ncbi:MAG: BMP family protein [Roseburia sp.]|nr:BMP family protein [Roseburia sp.]